MVTGSDRSLPAGDRMRRHAAILGRIFLIVALISMTAVTHVNAETGPGTTYSSYCSRKWLPTGASVERRYRAQLVTTTSSTATTFTVNWSLYINVNSAVTCNDISGTVSATSQTSQSGTAKLSYDAGDKKKLVKSGRFTWNKTTSAYPVNVTGAVKAKSTGGSNPWNGETVSTTQSFTVPALAYHTITYNSAGGSSVASGGNYYGYTVTVANPPVKDDCIFEYWDCGGNKWYPGDKVTMKSNYIFTAVWRSVHVSYNANRDTGGYNVSLADEHGPGLMIGGDGAITRDGAALVTSLPGVLVNPQDPGGLNLIKDGYHLEEGREWNSRSDGSGSDYNASDTYDADSIPESLTVYANWKPNTYTVSFYPNGDGDVTGAMPDQTLTVDKTENIESNSYMRPGFRLAGWDTDPGADPFGSLTVSGDRGSVMNLSRTQDANIALYAVWKPIEETQAEIYAGKIVKSNAVTDKYRFRLEAVEGWSHENEASAESGKHIAAGDMPMPEGTPIGQQYSESEVTGLAGNSGVLRAGSTGLITFEDPGWYLYKIAEVIPDHPEEGITYDRTSYYVAVYVCYKEETGSKVRVYSVTAWHNSRGSERNRPELTDISEITDNNGLSALDNEEGTYGKTGIGQSSVLVRFWNDERNRDEPAPDLVSLRIGKNVTGSLGDLTKKFRFTASFSGLAANTSYSILSDGAELESETSGAVLSADESGNAQITFFLRDGEGLMVENMPADTSVCIKEDRSDHFPAYRITEERGNVLKEDSRNKQTELSTGDVVLSEADGMYYAEFTNSRNLMPPTGLSERIVPVSVAIAAALAAVLLVISTKKSNKK